MQTISEKLQKESEEGKEQTQFTDPDYKVLNRLGAGGFGYVLEAQDRKTGKKYAWKRSVKLNNHISREIEVLQLMRYSPNVIQIQKYFYTRNHLDQVVQNIILEIGESDVEKYLYTTRKYNPLSLMEAKKLMKPIISGLKDLHFQGVCHRDLKP